MRILILGGTVFLGRHVVDAALARGHDVTVFTRGVHPVPPGVEHRTGDRAGDLSALDRGEWDAVLDTSGYQAADVRRLAERLADRAGHYVFVSSVNVYPAWPAEPVDEDSPVWESGDDYGAQKALSERALEAALPARVATVRAGLICGPHDNVFRLPWWVRRIARGGRVPAPGAPGRPVQLVDARDLAAFMLDLGERRLAGAFNGTAPAGQQTMGEVLDAAVAATGSGAELVWVPDERLQAAEVEPWVELPLWIPAAEFPGTWQVGTERAQAAGLRCRPVAQTVADVWSWLRAGGESELDEWRAEHRPRPMDVARERALLGS
ncbi:MAG TPA: NAD-dependent epimerase/dehydratase family protein [Solirubrobacteraceae bacterium]|nr:NAD-dependent epimerase/dehydratase family protein [Solirubrobacteraceae bacterium]